MIYRIDAELAREQAQWFVIGLIALLRHDHLPARPPLAGALPLHDRRRGDRAAGAAAAARHRRAGERRLPGREGRPDPVPAGRVRQDRDHRLPRELPARHGGRAGARAAAAAAVPEAAAAVRRRGGVRAARAGCCSTSAPAETVLLAIFTASLAAILRERPSLKHFGPLLLVWGLAMLMLLFIRDLGSSLMFFGGFLALLYVATGAALAGGRGGHDVPRRRHLLRQQREPRAGARGHLARPVRAAAWWTTRATRSPSPSSRRPTAGCSGRASARRCSSCRAGRTSCPPPTPT